jgi:hypothetical protein
VGQRPTIKKLEEHGKKGAWSNAYKRNKGEVRREGLEALV